MRVHLCVMALWRHAPLNQAYHLFQNDRSHIANILKSFAPGCNDSFSAACRSQKLCSIVQLPSCLRATEPTVDRPAKTPLTKSGALQHGWCCVVTVMASVPSCTTSDRDCVVSLPYTVMSVASLGLLDTLYIWETVLPQPLKIADITLTLSVVFVVHSWLRESVHKYVSGS